MFFKPLLLPLALATAASAAVFERAACNADYCLRALRATQDGGTRVPQASADCSRILYSTYTPPTITLTAYSTIQETTTATFSETTTSTFFDTLTTVVKATQTIEATTTTTTTVGISAGGIILERAESIQFPAYASWCSGIVRFSSACSCIGVTARTITVEAPVTVTTLPTTSTTGTSITNTVSTSITVTDTTISQTTTDATTTSYSTFTAVPSAVARIYRNGAATNQYIYVKAENTNNDSYNFVDATTDLGLAIKVKIQPGTNRLLWGEKFLKGPSNASNVLMWFSPPSFNPEDRVPVITSINPANFELSFTANGQTVGLFITGSNSIILSTSPVPYNSNPITLRLVYT